MFNNEDEFRAAGEELLQLCERHERGEVSTQQLLTAWKLFTRQSFQYLDCLKQIVDSHPDWN